MSSKLPSILAATDEEIQLLLAAQSHIGTKNCDKQMEPYVWKRRADGVCLSPCVLRPCGDCACVRNARNCIFC